MHYMIHACPDRMWYVTEHLIPMLMERGVPEDDVAVWNDTERAGCLESCMRAFLSLDGTPGGTWHLQDDVLPCRDFAERTRDTELVTAGFCCRNFQVELITGQTHVNGLWYSFPCIHIPNTIAAACARWFYEDASKRPNFRDWVQQKRNDDSFFRVFLQEEYPHLTVRNETPNLVEHVDFLIGGTLINQARLHRYNRAAYWEDEDLVTALATALESRV